MSAGMNKNMISEKKRYGCQCLTYNKQMIGEKKMYYGRKALDTWWSRIICGDGFILQHPLSSTLTLCMISRLRSRNISIISYQGPVFSVEILYNLSACLTKRYYTSPCVTIRLLHVCGCDKQPYPFFIRHRDRHCRLTRCTHIYTHAYANPNTSLIRFQRRIQGFVLTSCCIREFWRLFSWH